MNSKNLQTRVELWKAGFLQGYFQALQDQQNNLRIWKSTFAVERKLKKQLLQQAKQKPKQYKWVHYQNSSTIQTPCFNSTCPSHFQSKLHLQSTATSSQSITAQSNILESDDYFIICQHWNNYVTPIQSWGNKDKTKRELISFTGFKNLPKHLQDLYLMTLITGNLNYISIK